MRPFTLLLPLALAACLALTPPPLPAGWGGASCAPVWSAPSLQPAFQPAPVFPAPLYSWERFADGDPGYWLLRRDGQAVGCVRVRDGRYTPWDGRAWGAPCDVPVALPAIAAAAAATVPCPNGCCPGDRCPCQGGRKCDESGCACQVAAAVPNFGVAAEHIRPGRTTICGREVSRAAAYEAIEAGVPDDSGRQRLTVIGSDADRQKVVADLAGAPELAAYRDKVVVKDYAPDRWEVTGAGFVAKGSPTVYLQAADGQVLHRQDDYAGGPKALAKALRRAQPDYDPSKDPDLRVDPVRPAPPAPPAPAPAPPPAGPDATPAPAPAADPLAPLKSVPLSGWLFGLAAGAVGYLLIRKGNP